MHGQKRPFRQYAQLLVDPCTKVAAQGSRSRKAKYGGMNSGEAKRLKQLEDENRRLKHVVAELTLDNRALKDVFSKTW